MATTTLPRPSLPPSAPLPSLPVAKTRKSSVTTTPTASNASPQALTSLPQPSRSPSSVSLGRPSRPSLGSIPNNSTSNLPKMGATPGSGPPAKLRKTISVGSFPQPPKLSPLSNSQASSPGFASPIDSPPSSAVRTPGPGLAARRAASQGGSISAPRRPNRTSSSRPNQTRNFTTSGTPSLLNGAGDHQSVSYLNLPSPPPSRGSSEDDPDEPRGRHSSLDVSKTDADKLGKDTKGNVLVSVRVRPDVVSNDGGRTDLEWMVDGRRSLISYRGKEGGEYYYDNVFAAHDQNAKVYDSAAKRLVRRVMEGYHGTVFAYGMTGTGKTFSMQGTATSPGVIPLAITDIFSFIRETPHREFLLRVSYLEIYNEKIHDLLSAPVAGINGQPTVQEEIKLREDSKRGVYASPLKEEIVQSPTQLLRVIARGDAARRVAGTMYNARSSRSHAVVQIVVESRARAAPSAAAESARSPLPPGGVRVSTLSLIDLAGSERAAETKERRTEGAHINKSLLTLGTVISKLSGDKTGNSADKDKHLPYRDSKLTRLLQGALSGDSLVSILCTIQIGAAGSVATAQNHTMETLNTLKFASRAKNNIVSHAKKADEAFAGSDPGSRALLERYRVEISELRKQLDAQSKTGKEREAIEARERDDEAEKARELQAEQRHEEQMLEMQLARTALKERIEHLNRLILSSRSLGVNNSARSFSSLSMADGGPGAQQLPSRSARSSTATLENEAAALRRTSSATGSMRSFRQSGASVAIAETPEAEDAAAAAAEAAADEEEDSLGSNGDGTAPMALQVRALQADLADKNRYIQTLEKRLLQARRSSHSRVSMQFSPRFGSGPSASPNGSGPANGGSPSCSSPVVGTVDEAGVDALLRDKDAEISDLRARLDDKERMVRALREAARKRDVADLGLEKQHQLQQANPQRVASLSSLRRRSAALGSPRTSLTGARSVTPLQQQGRATPQPPPPQGRSTPQPLQPQAKKEQAPPQPKDKQPQDKPQTRGGAAAPKQDARSSSGSGSGSGGSATSSGVFMAPHKAGASKGSPTAVAAPTIVTTDASAAPAAKAVSPTSPAMPQPPKPIVAPPPVVEGNRRRSVDEMTRLLDEMITERVQGAAGKKGRFVD